MAPDLSSARPLHKPIKCMAILLDRRNQIEGVDTRHGNISTATSGTNQFGVDFVPPDFEPFHRAKLWRIVQNALEGSPPNMAYSVIRKEHRTPKPQHETSVFEAALRKKAKQLGIDFDSILNAAAAHFATNPPTYLPEQISPMTIWNLSEDDLNDCEP